MRQASIAVLCALLPALALAQPTDTHANVESTLAASLDEALREASSGTPGVAAAVVFQGRVWLGAEGFADVGEAIPMTTITPFYIGSVSKTMTAVVALKLSERGVVDLRAPVTNYLPRWRMPDAGMTLHHLLTHSSGLSRGGGFDYWFTARFPSAQELRRGIAGATLIAPLGERWSYSNVGYALIGQVLRGASGERFASLVQSELLIPLNMDQSGFGRPRGLAMGYAPAGGRRIRRGTRSFAGHGRRVGSRRERIYHGANAMRPAFGIHSTARDMARYLRALLADDSTEGAVIATAVRRGLFTLQVPFDGDPQSGWTHGLRRKQDDQGEYFRHSGWYAAHRSELWLRPSQALGIVVLTNADDGNPHIIARTLAATLSGSAASPRP
ncbi:MAG: serine hydrolase domain-containing protein [Polyangiales bacterium]